MTSRQGITNRSKAKSKNARNRGPTPRFPANRILYRDNFCLSLRPIRILHGRLWILHPARPESTSVRLPLDMELRWRIERDYQATVGHQHYVKARWLRLPIPRHVMHRARRRTFPSSRSHRLESEKPQTSQKSKPLHSRSEPSVMPNLVTTMAAAPQERRWLDA